MPAHTGSLTAIEVCFGKVGGHSAVNLTEAMVELCGNGGLFTLRCGISRP